MENELGNKLKFDGLHEAEQITGKSYKEDGMTSALGMQMTMANNARKSELLQQSNDTHFNMSWKSFVELIESRTDYPFTQIHLHSWRDEKNTQQREVRMWINAEKGLLLVADNFGGSVNSGSIHYQALMSGWPTILASGGFQHYDEEQNQGIYNGNFDIREGLFFRLDSLSKDIIEWHTPWTRKNNHSIFVWYPGDLGRRIDQKLFDEVFDRRPENERKIFEAILEVREED